MFTGLIEAVAEVRTCGESMLAVERPEAFTDVHVGSSICVSGACLTIAELAEREMQFDLTKETLARTTIGSLKQGDRVNLERSMKADARLEGHIVQGHIEATGRIANGPSTTLRTGKWQIANDGDAFMEVELPKLLLPFIVTKGSIAVDGVSLTVASIEGNSVTIALIPHTLENTTLGGLKTGDRVNVETDILMRRAEQLIIDN